MGDRLKSAYELAMERLSAKGGGEAALSEAQKARIAEIRAEFKARRAEAEFLHRNALEAAQGGDDPGRVQRLEDEFARERERMAAHEEEQVRAVRGD